MDTASVMTVKASRTGKRTRSKRNAAVAIDHVTTSRIKSAYASAGMRTVLCDGSNRKYPNPYRMSMTRKKLNMARWPGLKRPLASTNAGPRVRAAADIRFWIAAASVLRRSAAARSNSSMPRGKVGARPKNKLTGWVPG
jgi:hypothetical protein